MVGVSKVLLGQLVAFFFSSRRRHTRCYRDWSSDVCSSDLLVLDRAAEPDPDAAARVLPMLASLLATAIDREQVRRSDAAKTAVLRSVSHDLRSPITAIITASEVLESSRDSVSADERDELLRSIHWQGRRFERAVANLLDLSRLEAGVAQPSTELWT